MYRKLTILERVLYDVAGRLYEIAERANERQWARHTRRASAPWGVS